MSDEVKVEDITEAEAQALIEARGLRYCPNHNPNHPIAGLRFFYRDRFAPVSTGGAMGYGTSRRAAAIKLVGCLSAPK